MTKMQHFIYLADWAVIVITALWLLGFLYCVIDEARLPPNKRTVEAFNWRKFYIPLFFFIAAVLHLAA